MAYADVPLIDPATGRFPDEFAPASVAADASAAEGARDVAVGARDDAVEAVGVALQARDEAVAAREAAEAVPAQVDTAMAAQVGAGGEFDTKLTATIDGVATPAARTAAEQYLASQPGVVAAAESAVSSAGQAVFLKIGGPTSLLGNSGFDTAPVTANTPTTGNWYNVDGTQRSWVDVSDGPNGATKVLRILGTAGWLGQRAAGLVAGGFAGKKLVVSGQARALQNGAAVVCPLRVMVLNSSSGTVTDQRVSDVPLSWTPFRVEFTAPAGNDLVTVLLGAHAGAPLGSTRLELDNVTLALVDSDVRTIAADVVSAEAAKGSILTPGQARADFVPLPQRQGVSRTEQVRAWKGGGIGVGDKPVVALRFDDWQAAFKANIFGLLKDRGLPAGYTHISRLDQQAWTAGVTWDDIKTWWLHGVEAWSHGTDHKDPSPQGYAGLVDQIVNSRAEIESHGLPVTGWMQPGASPLTAGVPYGTNWAKMSDFVTTPAGRLIAATYGVSCADTIGQYRIIPSEVTYGLAHFTVSDGASLAVAKSYVDNAIASGTGVQLMTHAGNLGGSGMSLADYTALLDYIVAKRDAGIIEVLTPGGLIFANRSTKRFNLMQKGTFEGVATGGVPYSNWATATVETSGGHSGTNFLRIPSTMTTLVQQSLGVNHNLVTPKLLGMAGGQLVFKAWVRASAGGSAAFRLLVQDYDDNTALNLDVVRTGIGPEWRQVHVPFSVPEANSRLVIAFGRSDVGSDGIDIDDIELLPI